MTSSLPVIRQFGEDMAVGVLLAFLITFALVPFALYYLPKDVLHIKVNWLQGWNRMAGNIMTAIKKKSNWIIGSALFLALGGIAGITKINTNNMFFGSFPKKHPAVKATNFYEKNLGGIRNFEIALSPKENNRLNKLPLLREVDNLHRHIDSLPGTGSVYSPATYYKSLNQAWHGGRKTAYTLPESEKLLNRQEEGLKNGSANFFNRIINKERTFGKI